MVKILTAEMIVF